MDRRTVVKGALWATPAVIVASTAPTVAASTMDSITEACKLPAQNKTAYYRLSVTATAGCNISAVFLDGEKLSSVTPSVLVAGSNTITVGETENANAQIVFTVITDKGTITQTVKALPCKN